MTIWRIIESSISPFDKKKRKKRWKNFVGFKKSVTFATAFREMLLPVEGNAVIAQLVEHDLAKVGVASSSLVYRSIS